LPNRPAPARLLHWKNSPRRDLSRRTRPRLWSSPARAWRLRPRLLISCS